MEQVDLGYIHKRIYKKMTFIKYPTCQTLETNVSTRMNKVTYSGEKSKI